MSVRYEWVRARTVQVDVASETEFVGDSRCDPGHYALVLGIDDVVVVEGTPDELREFAARISRACGRLPGVARGAAETPTADPPAPPATA